jgi:hypothetical protein
VRIQDADIECSSPLKVFMYDLFWKYNLGWWKWMMGSTKSFHGQTKKLF